MSKLNERQFMKAIEFAKNELRANGADPAQIEAELESLSQEDLQDISHGAFLKLRESEKINTRTGQSSFVAGAVDTLTFGQLSNVTASTFAGAAAAIPQDGTTYEQRYETAKSSYKEEFEDYSIEHQLKSPTASLVGSIAGYFIGAPAAIGKALTSASGKVFGKAAAKTATRTVAKAVGQGAFAAGGFGAVEGVLRPDRTVIEGTTIGAVAGGAIPLVGAGGRAAIGGLIKGTTKLKASVATKLANVSPEMREVITNMDDLVKLGKEGIMELSSSAKTTGDDMVRTIAGMYDEAVGRAARTFDEASLVKDAGVRKTLTKILGDSAQEISDKAARAGGIAKEELLETTVELSKRLGTMKKALGTNYGEVFEPIAKKLDTAGAVFDVSDLLGPIVKGLPEGSLSPAGAANKFRLGVGGAAHVESIKKSLTTPKTFSEMIELKKAIGNMAEWSDEALRGADEQTIALHKTLRDSFTLIRNKLTEAAPELDTVFSEYATGLKAVDKAKSVFATARMPTKSYEQSLDFLLTRDKRSAVKLFDPEVRSLTTHALKQTRRILETSKYSDLSKTQTLLNKAVKNPAILDEAERVVGPLSNRTRLTQQIEALELHPRLEFALKNPFSTEAQKGAEEFLERVPSAKPVYQSALNKARKAIRLQGLEKPSKIFADAKSSGAFDPNAIDQMEHLTALIPELQQIMRAETLERLSKSVPFENLSRITPVKVLALGAPVVELAMEKGEVDSRYRNYVRMAGGVAALAMVSRDPILLHKIAAEAKIKWSKEALDRTVAKISMYNEKIRPLLFAAESSRERQ